MRRIINSRNSQENTRRRSRRGQTFSLVNLIEILMGIAVILVIGVGLMSMVSRVTFIQQFFAKDNAYLVETLHAVPNGHVTYGYLWNGKNYHYTIEKSLITVQRVSGMSELFKSSAPVTKYFGTSERTTIPRTTLTPEYFQYVTAGTQERSITVVGRVNNPTCPQASSIDTVKAPLRNEPSGLSAAITANVIERVQQERLRTGSGPRIAIVFRAEPETAISVVPLVTNDVTERMVCVMERELRRASLAATRDSPSNVATSIRAQVSADILIIVRGTISLRQQYTDAIGEGILGYWKPNAAEGGAVVTP
jgi:hypothetical protein